MLIAYLFLLGQLLALLVFRKKLSEYPLGFLSIEVRCYATVLALASLELALTRIYYAL